MQEQIHCQNLSKLIEHNNNGVEMVFLLREIPLSYPHYYYLLAGANTNENIFQRSILVITTVYMMGVLAPIPRNPVSLQFWLQESEHRLDTVFFAKIFNKALFNCLSHRDKNKGDDKVNLQ